MHRGLKQNAVSFHVPAPSKLQKNSIFFRHAPLIWRITATVTWHLFGSSDGMSISDFKLPWQNRRALTRHMTCCCTPVELCLRYNAHHHFKTGSEGKPPFSFIRTQEVQSDSILHWTELYKLHLKNQHVRKFFFKKKQFYYDFCKESFNL